MDAVLRRVRAIEIKAKTLFREQFAGEFRSAFRGRGLEFSEIRTYLPGDDVRFIDWNVTARRGEPFLKQYVEERERSVWLLLDVSASQEFGTVGRSTRDFAVELAGLLGYAAALSRDRVGAVAFSDRIEYTLPPRKSTRHVLRLIRDLLALRPAGRGTDLAGALDYAGRLLRRGSVVFVISDFHADGPWDSALRRLGRRHDVVALVVRDPREAALEAALPGGGLLVLEDAESGRTLVVDAAALAAARPRETAAEVRLLQQRLRAAGIDHLFLPSGSDYLPPLIALFRARARRR